MSFLWAVRGKSWGFRFLRDGGFDDPLPVYEAVYSGLELGAEGYRRVGERVALRLEDPEHRRDRAGRPISHDFVLLGELADKVDSVDDGLREVWPLVEKEYGRLWDSPQAPLSA